MSGFVCVSLVIVLGRIRGSRGSGCPDPNAPLDLYSGGLSANGSSRRGIFIDDSVERAQDSTRRENGISKRILDERLHLDLNLNVDNNTASGRRWTKGYKGFVPMLLILKLTAMMVVTLAMIKFLLLVATVATNVSLLVSAFVLAKHLVYYGMTALATHVFLPYGAGQTHYKDTGLDLSGYGYNSYNNEHLIPDYVKPEYLSSTEASPKYSQDNYAYS